MLARRIVVLPLSSPFKGVHIGAARMVVWRSGSIALAAQRRQSSTAAASGSGSPLAAAQRLASRFIPSTVLGMGGATHHHHQHAAPASAANATGVASGQGPKGESGGGGEGSDPSSPPPPPPNGNPSSGSSSWRDTITMGLLLLAGSLLYDTLITNKDALMAMLRELFVVTLEVRSSQDEFFVILEWLAHCSTLGQTSRNLMVTEKGNAWRNGNNGNGSHDHDGGADTAAAGDGEGTQQRPPWDISPGIGTHSISHNNKRFWVTRRFDSDKGKGVNLSDTLPQVLTLSCFARDRAVMDALLAEMHAWYKVKMAEKVPIYVVDGSEWVSVGAKSRRDLASVFLPQTIKDTFVKDIGTFLKSEPLYKALGLPWRRGYLFYGPPGTGKSSLIAAMASEYRLPVYLMSFKGQGHNGAGDGGGEGPDLMWLTKLINTCQRPCVLVMEDLDTSSIATRGGAMRDGPTGDGSEDTSPSLALQSSPSSSSAVSGLLNALDGLPSTDGKILIITANDPSRLPKALLRPGRVDDSIAFDVMGPAEKAAMAERFRTLADNVKGLPDRKVVESGPAACRGSRQASGTETLRPTETLEVAASPAEVQNKLLNELLYRRV